MGIFKLSKLKIYVKDCLAILLRQRKYGGGNEYWNSQGVLKTMESGYRHFGIKSEVEVYLDYSLKNYDYFYPACGSANSAIRMKYDELEKIAKAKKWVDVCKERVVER